jgi:uncharacterized protein (TIGR03437 family)
LAPGGETPAARSRHETAFVPELAAAFFFGGQTSAGLTNELLMLSPAASVPQFSSSSISNAFSGETGAVAPGEIVSIFGSGLGPTAGAVASFDAAGRLPVWLERVSVTFNGTPAPVYFARADQLNIQVPYELAGATEADVVVSYNGFSSPPQRLRITPSRPGLYPRAFNQDGSLNAPENPAAIGSIVVLFGTGQGVTDPSSQTGRFPFDGFPIPAAPVLLRIGDRLAELLFRGQAPGTAGVIQINARIPDGIRPGIATSVVLTVGTAESQPGVTIAVQ